MAGVRKDACVVAAGRGRIYAFFFLVLAALAGHGADFWTSHVEPLLKEHCTECHNPTKAKSGLDLSSLQAILRGGERGAAVVAGRPEESNLYKFLSAEADVHMPPGKREKLSEEEIGLIRTWIQKMKVAAPALAENATEGPPTHPPTPAKAPIKWEPPAKMPPAEVVDGFLSRAWKRDKIEPAKRIDDAGFVRRVYLDLIGRIPTADEAARFASDRSGGKRAQIIETLLATDEYARHMREVFDSVLMDRRGADWEDRRRNQKWFAFLEDAFGQNRPWNEVVRDLVVARPERDEDRGAVWYLYERQNNAQAIAEALGPVVFGVQVKCAQCHDHMVAREIKQAHYWGMVAAFNRSKNVDTPKGPGVAESAVGGFVSFANLKKESQPAVLTFFNGRSVEEQRPKEGEKENDLPELYLVPPSKPAEAATDNKSPQRRRRQQADKADEVAVPKFSRRAAFADAVTRDNPLLARAMVNRIWAMLFGRGLVHPVDLMDSKHPPSHPELLDWLTKDFEHSGYDVKRLVRTLCNTRAYQLDSRTRGKGKPPEPESFARVLDKPLIAEQLLRTLLIATANQPDKDGKIAGMTERELRLAFINKFPDLFPPEYNATLSQAMFLANSPLFDQLFAPRGENLAAQLIAQPDAEARVRRAFQSVFGREPDREELRECVSYLAARSPEWGVKQLLWAMLSSAEFQLNH